MLKCTDEEIIDAAKSSLTMTQAAAKLNIHYNTFKKHAERLGCFKPNQAGQGIKKKPSNEGYLLEDILAGMYPSYQTGKLKHRLLNSGIFEARCDICELSVWMGKPITLELDHIDGDRTNHMLENLRILCPNCHAQTPTWRGKRRNHQRGDRSGNQT